jgi:hypothetical protein
MINLRQCNSLSSLTSTSLLTLSELADLIADLNDKDHSEDEGI